MDFVIAMSWSLAKRGLELFEDELNNSGRGKKSKGSSGSTKLGKSTLRQGVQRAAKQKKKNQQRNKQASQHLIQKQVPNALKKYAYSSPQDQTEDNLRLLRKIDRKQAPAQYLKQVAEHHDRELEKKKVKSEDFLNLDPKHKKTVSESVFTDEDFEKVNDKWLQLY